MPVPLKDFDKDATDFFKIPAGFKYESKTKAPANVVYINPGYEKGVLTVNMHYDVKDKSKNVKTKIGVSDNDTFATKVIAESATCGSKVEFNNKFNTKKCCDYTGDIIYTLTRKDYCFFLKSAYSNKARTNADLQLSVQAHKNVQLGAQVVFNYLKTMPDAFKVGARLSCCSKNSMALTYDNKGVASISALLCGLKIQKMDIASYFRLSHAKPTGLGLNVGFQTICPITTARVQVKADHKGTYAISFLRKFGDISVLVGGSAKYNKLSCPFAPGQAFLEISRE